MPRDLVVLGQCRHRTRPGRHRDLDRLARLVERHVQQVQHGRVRADLQVVAELAMENRKGAVVVVPETTLTCCDFEAYPEAEAVQV